MAKKPSKLKRETEIARIMLRYGFGHLVESGGALSYILAPCRIFAKTKPSKTTPEQVRHAIEELGPTYIKVGQAASMRPDLIPPEYAEELSKLQEQAPAAPYEEIEAVIREEFGCPPKKLFAHFDREPAGSASLAQAHFAKLHSGECIIVKVQRPHIRERIEQDLPVLEDLVDFVSEHWDEKAVDIKGWFSEFEFTLRQELDFIKEGHNAERFRQNFGDEAKLKIPCIYWDYSTSRVLAMERIEGTRLTDFNAIKSKKLDRKELARTVSEIQLKMIFEQGFFHADPHAGNMFALDDGRIALIDCGMVGRLDEEVRDSLLRIALAFSQRNANQLTDEVLSFTYAKGRVDRQELKRTLAHIILDNADAGPNEISFSNVLREVMMAATTNGLVVPSSVAILTRALGVSEGIVKGLDPEFDFADFSQPYLEDILKEKYTAGSLAHRAKVDGPFLADLLLNLPQRAERFLSQMERGEFAVISRVDDVDEILLQLHQAANRLSMSVLVAALTIALSIFTAVYRPGGQRPGSLVDLLLVVVICGGLGTLLAIWRSGRK